MQSNWVQSVAALVTAYGYPLLLLVSVTENVVLVGLAIPGDAVAVLAGAACANAILAPVPTTLVLACGAVTGAVLSYGIGARGGLVLAARWGDRIGLTSGRIASAHRYFERHGSKTVLVGCFISGVKNLVPAIAGASGMRLVPFVAYSVTAAVLRSVGLVALGYGFARSLEQAFVVLHTADAWLAALLGASVVGWIVVWGLRRRRRGALGKGGARRR